MGKLEAILMLRSDLSMHPSLSISCRLCFHTILPFYRSVILNNKLQNSLRAFCHWCKLYANQIRHLFIVCLMACCIHSLFLPQTFLLSIVFGCGYRSEVGPSRRFTEWCRTCELSNATVKIVLDSQCCCTALFDGLDWFPPCFFRRFADIVAVVASNNHGHIHIDR